MSQTGSSSLTLPGNEVAPVLQQNPPTSPQSPPSSGEASGSPSSPSHPSSSSSPPPPPQPQQPYRAPFAPRPPASPISRPGAALRAASASFLPTSAPTSLRIANRLSSMNNMPTPPLMASGSNTVPSDSASRPQPPSPGPDRRSRSQSLAAHPDIAATAEARARAREARIQNDAMVYLDGPLVYTCGQCRTHLTSHDDIISKSFHGRHGRAYLFDQCVNVTIGPPEDRILITGMHSVCDIFCKRCKGMVGWTYAKAYEASQKYKEGKFIIEKINLHLEENPYYDIHHPAGERPDRWRVRSMSWGSDDRPLRHHRRSVDATPSREIVFEYRPSTNGSGDATSRPSPASAADVHMTPSANASDST